MNHQLCRWQNACSQAIGQALLFFSLLSLSALSPLSLSLLSLSSHEALDRVAPTGAVTRPFGGLFAKKVNPSHEGEILLAIILLGIAE
mmetsp:Transcript_39713/g.104203  ORF Transcript_39713/g.104203 Transcript_39713/m.104203 type:complete len:88 (-) Transcript_39713:1748-2011(-)